jgi:DNA-binding response OmpR family regulator
MRVLVVEDERLLADAIAEWLRREALAVDVAYDGEAALQRLSLNDYDVMVLDRDLPAVHGDDVCRATVESGARTRILMLTAAGALTERVAGLELGADDYLSKPFALVELSARIRALMRRARSATPPVMERGTGVTSRCPARSSPSSPNSCGPRGRWFPLRSYSNGPGMRTPTRLPT